MEQNIDIAFDLYEPSAYFGGPFCSFLLLSTAATAPSKSSIPSAKNKHALPGTIFQDEDSRHLSLVYMHFQGLELPTTLDGEQLPVKIWMHDLKRSAISAT